MMTLLRGLPVALLTVGLSACVHAPPPAAPAADQRGAPADTLPSYQSLVQAEGGQVLRLDPAASRVRILVFRAGRAARLGHNHVLSAPRFEGRVYLPPRGVAGARFELGFRLDQLRFDDPALRAALGPAFEATLTPEAIAGTRAHMLGDENMQAARYPQVTVRSLEVAGEPPLLAARVRIELHGQAREQWVPLAVDGLPDHLRVSGRFVLRQTDYGVHPFSVAGGLLAVQDEVVVDFQLAAAAAAAGRP